MSEPWPGQPQIEARLITSGTTDIGSWDGQLVLQSTESRSWNDIDWQLTVPAATWTRRNTYGVNDLVARLTTRGQLVTLQSVALPNQQRLRGSGRYNLENHQWNVNLAGRSVELPRIADTAIDFALVADGDANHYVKVRRVEMTAGELNFTANGFYDIREPQPVGLNFTAQHTPSPMADADPFIRGQLRSAGRINGTLSPFDLDITGELFGKGLIVRERPIGDPRVELTGKVLADAARVETTELQLLGGVWQFLGTWDGEDDAVHVELAVRNLPASEVGDVLEVQDIRGTVSGNWRARVPALRLNRITAEGDVRIDTPVAGEFLADQLTAHSTLNQGVVRLDPIEARSGRGSAHATVQFRTDQPLRWRAQLTARDWPLDYLTDDGQISAAVQTGPMELDLETRSAWGEVALGAQLGLYGSNLGDLEARTRLEGRTLTLRRAQGELLGGRLDAMGVFSLDQPLNTRGQLTLDSVNIVEATRLWPSLEGLEGMYSLSATLGPPSGPRPLGPLELRASLMARNGRYNTVEIGDASLVAYYAPPAEGQRERFIINQSHFTAAGGEIRLWGRSTRQPHPTGESYFASQLQIELENLQLDPIIHAVHETEDQYPALLHGSITLTGDAQDYRNLYGQGRVELTESDLIGVDFIGFLYRRVVGAEPQEPIGHGQVDVRFEAGALNVTSFRYFNRGFEVRATAVADDLWALGESPVNGTAFGTAQPLRGLRLPFFSDVDRILEVIQRDAVSVRISGRLEDYNVEVVPFAEVGDTVRRMLLGDIRDEVRGGAAP